MKSVEFISENLNSQTNYSYDDGTINYEPIGIYKAATNASYAYHGYAWYKDFSSEGDRYTRVGPINEYNHVSAIKTGYNLFGNQPIFVLRI